MAQLRVTSTVLHGAVFALDGELFTIGRAPDNRLRLGHPSISQHHAIITVKQADFIFRDLHSTNGTFINGERTIFRHLQDGDRLVLGEIQLHFDLHGTASPQPPPPLEVSLGETQLLAGTVRQPRSQAAQINAAKPTGPPPAPNSLIAVITPPAPPVALKKDFAGFPSRLEPPVAAVQSTHKELRESMTTPMTKSCVEIPPPVKSSPKPTDAAAKTDRQRLIAIIILMAGGIIIGAGYSSSNALLKILGFLIAVTSFFALQFDDRKR